MKYLIAAALTAGLALFGAATASAETGKYPVYDQACMNPAFVNAKHGVGMAGKNARCATAKHPASYGSGPDDEVVTP
ncbi:hypothetical protein BANE1_87 [Mycobacterium phage Bane1]|uniref:Uncharacterized protein n=5 Tax=Coopervirus TaxID=1982898 RepID=A0A345KWQ2_9CAUD|nr:hypothetical protein BANE1_87 [Mycobacterium phage Bane1]YP_010089275.1 hypothetical protein KNT58_gp88 [Mycobacterium phage Fortunato]AGU92198.1 hypothetical protein BANE2_87 [Mycobacterium phage Bane2]AXH47454.1 hypothetical protein SEA_HANGMAN_91 [Mycobacterium phage Hangman]QNO13115.1 hypothetical protein SEA_VIOLETZ_93 [Mycobacterium phage VioletZ]AGU92092.1 hypothetical protein BANE1_87 [Mycobacterium phage Bane1]AOT27319.1 hypothetical protein SEA_FORTUNATO_88 [Mycobacterium phage F